MIWITSDTHFCHNKEFIYKARGFNSLEEMESFIINDWQKVQDDDVVYVLGGVSPHNNEELRYSLRSIEKFGVEGAERFKQWHERFNNA